MGIKKLIDNQQIRIDSHQRGSEKANTWDPIEDVHLHNNVNRKKKESYEIRVSLNTVFICLRASGTRRPL